MSSYQRVGGRHSSNGPPAMKALWPRRLGLLRLM